MVAGYVYLIGSPKHKWYKIGCSSNAAVRLSDLGILLPFKLHVIAIWKTESYKSFERRLHELYAEDRINGEWFKFGRKKLKSVIAEWSYLSTDIPSNFTNVKQRREINFLLTPEECEARKHKSIQATIMRKLEAGKPLSLGQQKYYDEAVSKIPCISE